MVYYCDVYTISKKQKNKYKHFKSNRLKEFDKQKLKISSSRDINVNDVDDAFCLYIIEYNKKHDYYLIKCEFNLVFNDNFYKKYLTSQIFDNETMISWSSFLEKSN